MPWPRTGQIYLLPWVRAPELAQLAVCGGPDRMLRIQRGLEGSRILVSKYTGAVREHNHARAVHAPRACAAPRTR